jgi:squalene cyclase
LWQDFPGTAPDDPWQMLFGSSDEWVSAYVAAAVGAFDRLNRKDVRDAVQWVWRLLTKRRSEGFGWGYSCISPADADSTVWGLRLAQVVGASRSTHALNAYAFLRRHQQHSGGIATYLPEAAIRDFSALQPSTVNAWCEPHVCVTAAAANLPELQKDCLRSLRDTQKADGRWNSYWWTDSEYSTGLATSALARSDDTSDRARVARAAGWARERVSETGGVFSTGCNAEMPFATACNLLTLLSAKNIDRATIARSVQWLLRAQRSDGSWESSAVMRTPPVNVLDPDASGKAILARDRNSNFTTATVLTSLGLASAIR